MKMKIKVATEKSSNWFEELSPEEQSSYIKQHPRSKYARSVKHDAAPAVAPKTTAPSRAVQVSKGTTVVEGKLMMEDGSPLPEHIKKLGIPPGWKEVRVNPDPEGDLLAIGRDAKGRLQPIYSERFAATQAEAKFLRVQQLAMEYDAISAQNEKDRRSRDPKKRDNADCAFLVMRTGLRPGSDADTGADVKAYGATNLRAEHVVIEKGKTFLRFTGKKGVKINLEMDDPEVVKMLRRRKADSTDGTLFPTTSDKALLDYTRTLDGGHFKTKDFRTHLGTATAMQEAAKVEKPTDAKSYKQAVMNVAKKVAAKLGNTPTIALQSYINPVVFASWRL